MPDTVKARTMHLLADQFRPAWWLPPDLQWFGLSEYELARLFDVGATPPEYNTAHQLLSLMRRAAQDRLENIEDLTYYTRPHLCGEGWGLWGPESMGDLRNPKTSRFSLDRCEAYHRLWWIDVLLCVHNSEVPS